ncbi:MAG: hypothetical protein V3W44_09970 [Dehalococcoidales bacterium]
MTQQILILLMNEGTNFEAHGEAFALIKVPPNVDIEQAFEDIVLEAQALTRDPG